MGQTELLEILRGLPRGTYMTVESLSRLSGTRPKSVRMSMNKLERFDFVDKIKVSRVGDSTVFNLYCDKQEETQE